MSIKFHFLNVGDGDCTIIDFPERITEDKTKEKASRLMMVDMYHCEDHDTYEHILDYYKSNFKGKNIFRFIASHPHQDHLQGIKQLFEDQEISIINFWDLEHEFEPKKEGEKWESYKEDWEHYSKIRKTKDEEGIFVRRYWDNQNGEVQYWNEDRIDILSPSKELYDFAHKKEDNSKREPSEVDLNNMPYVLLLTVNKLKILLASDAESKCWEYIVDKHKDKIKNIDILKAAHHGRESGFYEEAVKLMNPKHIIFSISEDTDKKYGYDSEYKKHVPNAQIYKTFNGGTIIADCSFEGDVNITRK